MDARGTRDIPQAAFEGLNRLFDTVQGVDLRTRSRGIMSMQLQGGCSIFITGNNVGDVYNVTVRSIIY